jgi:hypothetical protein
MVWMMAVAARRLPGSASQAQLPAVGHEQAVVRQQTLTGEVPLGQAAIGRARGLEAGSEPAAGISDELHADQGDDAEGAAHQEQAVGEVSMGQSA